MAKPFGGGISSDKLTLLYAQLTDVQAALANVSKELSLEENVSADVDPAKMVKGSADCLKISQARDAVHVAIGDMNPQNPPGVAVRLAILVGELAAFQQRVRDLKDSYATVRYNPGQAPDC